MEYALSFIYCSDDNNATYLHNTLKSALEEKKAVISELIDEYTENNYNPEIINDSDNCTIIEYTDESLEPQYTIISISEIYK